MLCLQTCRGWVAVLCALFLLAGCARSTIDTRRQERWTAYQALPPEQQALVDQGQIRRGMDGDAVYIAWGPPAEIIESEDEKGHRVVWIYHGQTVEETRYWTFREVSHKGTVFLERRLESDFFPRGFVQAEITFADGEVLRWRTLPTPPGR